LKARKLGILTPAVYFAEAESSTIYMERLDAKMVKDLLLPGALPQDGRCFRGASLHCISGGGGDLLRSRGVLQERRSAISVKGVHLGGGGGDGC